MNINTLGDLTHDMNHGKVKTLTL